MSFACPQNLEQYRMQFNGESGDVSNGFLMIKSMGLAIMFSDGEGWQHVSVSRRSKNPTYEDMCWAKDQFWSDDICVMQLHVPAADHVNCHPYCLHLWHPLDAEIPRPPAIFVGPT